MIIGIYGKQGSGKTLLGVNTLLQKHKEYKSVYSNIVINGIQHKGFDAEFFDNLLELKIKDSLIFFDEIQEFMNSRKFMSVLNMDYGTFVRQVRKLGNTLIWTSQFVYQVDKVLRSNTDVYIKAHSNFEGLNKSMVDIRRLKINYEVFEVDAEGFLQLIANKSLNNPETVALRYDSSEIVKNDILDKNGELKLFLNNLCFEISGKYKYSFKNEQHKDLIRFAKMLRTDVFKILGLKNREGEKLKNLRPIE